MDNNYEQQFAKSVQSTVAPPPRPVDNSSNNSKLLIVLTIVMSVVVLVESIVLAITLANYFGTFEGDDSEGEEVVTDDYVDDSIGFDEDNNIKWLNIECTSDEGAKYVLNKDNTYKQINASSTTTASGTYSVVKNSLVSLSSSGTNTDTVLYYDGAFLADGLTIYNCEPEEEE